MSAFSRTALVLSAAVLWAAATRADDAEQTENPYYKHWSKSKVGETVEMKETTKTPANGDNVADEEVKLVRYKLIELTREKAVVETVVVEGEEFGFVESAPTKHTYPAKMNKAHFEDLLQTTGAKEKDAMVKVVGKELKARLISGTLKKGDEEIAFQFWITDEVPGGIAKRTRTTKVKGELIAEMTMEVSSFKRD
jgi:hypothetical protein